MTHILQKIILSAMDGKRRIRLDLPERRQGRRLIEVFNHMGFDSWRIGPVLFIEF